MMNVKTFGIALTCLVAVSCANLNKDDKAGLIDNVYSVYYIEVETPSGTGTGSAVAYRCEMLRENTYKTYFLTCKHIVENRIPDKPQYLYYNPDDRFGPYTETFILSRSKYDVEYVGSDIDIAVVSVITPYRIKTSEIDYSAPGHLTDVYTLGFPLGRGLHYSEGKTTFTDAEGQYACSSPIFYGNSGGGVYNKITNKLIGIACSLAAHPVGGPAVHLSFFIPASKLKEILP